MRTKNRARPVQKAERDDDNADAIDKTNNNDGDGEDQTKGRPSRWLLINRWKRAITLSRDVNDTELRILTVCLDHHTNHKTYEATGELEFFPGQQTLANECARHRETVGTALRHLKKLGVIQRLHAGGRDRGSNRYRFSRTWLIETERKLAKEGHLAFWPDKRLPSPTLVRERLSPSTVPARPSTVADTLQHKGTPGPSTVPALSHLSNSHSSKTVRKDHSEDRRQDSAYACGKKEKGKSHHKGHHLLGYGDAEKCAFEEVVERLKSAAHLDDRQMFDLFCNIYPKKDGNRDKLKHAWRNAVTAGTLVDVMAGALAWRIYWRQHRSDLEPYVPFAGQYLKWKGWERVLPYQYDDMTLESIKRILRYGSVEEFDEIAASHELPFDVLMAIADWPDNDREVVLNNFNALQATGTKATDIIKRAKTLVDECRDEKKKKKLPLLGKWLHEFPDEWKSVRDLQRSGWMPRERTRNRDAERELVAEETEEEYEPGASD